MLVTGAAQGVPRLLPDPLPSARPLQLGTLPALLCRLMFLAITSAGVSSDICTAKSGRKNQEGLRQETVTQERGYLSGNAGLSFRGHHPQVTGEAASYSPDCFHLCLSNLSFIAHNHQEVTALTVKRGSTTANPFPPLLLGVSWLPRLSLSRSFYNRFSCSRGQSIQAAPDKENILGIATRHLHCGHSPPLLLAGLFTTLSLSPTCRGSLSSNTAPLSQRSERGISRNVAGTWGREPAR